MMFRNKVKDDMSIKLSHSGKGKLDHCPRMFDLHYNEKIRPIGTTTSLLFGSAIDAAAEHYLLNKNKQDAIDVFGNKWLKQEINGTITDLRNCKEISFHSNDFDSELLLQSDHEFILQDTIFTSVSDLIEAGQHKEKIIYANWVSLLHKGFILLDAFVAWVDANVEQVLDVQCLIELIDENGDEITGKADFVLKMKGYDIPILVDLKTAARPYDRTSIKTSEQLALYYFYLKNSKYPEMKRVSYLVLCKQIKKNRKKTCQKCGEVTYGREQKCSAETTEMNAKGKPKKVRCNGEFSVEIFPEASIQYIHDEIPDFFVEQTVEKFGVAIEKIKTGVFEQNLNGCENYYGRRCPFFELCHNGDMTGLIKKE